MAIQQRRAITSIIIIGLLTLGVAAALGYAVTRSIASPLADLDEGAKALARRDFSHSIPVTGFDELTHLSQVFNNAAAQLEELYTDLENLVQERTQELEQSSEELRRRYLQLETSIAVGQRITSILNLDTLLSQMVELIREQYEYYYVGIFLLDDSGEYVVARTGTGEAGQQMLSERLRLKVGEEGLIGWVAKHGVSARVDDVRKDDRYLNLSMIPNTRSELALPLTMGRKLLGVLDLQSDEPAAFRLEDMPVWQLLANQVAIAIQNAQLYQGERSRRQIAETLYRVGRALSRTLDLREVLDLILKHLSEIVAYDRAAVMLRKDDQLEIQAARGFPTAIHPQQLRISIKENDVFEQIYHTQQPLSIPDVQERPDWQHVEGLQPTRAWLGVPLLRFGRVTGMLSLARETVDRYTDDEVKLATTFAGQAAIALENAGLYEEITQFTQTLEDQVRLRTEELQAANAQLKHLDQTKSDFINIAAHELRTPLTVLQGYSKMLLNDAKIKENSLHHELISGIHSGTTRLHEVINSMLDVAKIDARELKLYPKPLEVSTLVKLVCRQFSSALAERKQPLIIEDMSQLPAIEADPEALSKVFYHLINNAIKYTPDGGRITITGRAVTNGQAEAPGIEVVVADTGIGIDPEFQELIFTKFYQTGELALHSSGKTKFKGAGPGLGLAIARGIVEAHHGKVWADSEGEDEEALPGSRFHVYLPLRQKDT